MGGTERNHVRPKTVRQWRTKAARLWISVAVLGALLLTAGCAGGAANTHQTVASTRASAGKTDKTDKTPKVSLEIVVYGGALGAPHAPRPTSARERPESSAPGSARR